MRRSCHVAMVLAAVWLAGCASLPEYRPAPGAPAARLNMQGVGDKLLCVDGALYKPANDGDGGGRRLEDRARGGIAERLRNHRIGERLARDRPHVLAGDALGATARRDQRQRHRRHRLIRP